MTTSSILFSQTRPQSGKGGQLGGVPAALGEGFGNWFGFFFKFILFVGLVGGGIYGYQYFQRRKPYSGFGSGNFGGRANTFGGDAGGMLGPSGLGGSRGYGAPYANGKRF